MAAFQLTILISWHFLTFAPWIWLFVFSSIFFFPYIRFQDRLISFFLIFFNKVSNKVRKVAKPDFWKKVLTGQKDPKSAWNGPKIRFLGFLEKFDSFICTFSLECESFNGFLTFCKNHITGKNLVLELWSVDLSEYRIF